MSSDIQLSGDQALDDYFTALLDEEELFLDATESDVVDSDAVEPDKAELEAVDENEQLLPEPEPEPEPEPLLQSVEEKSYYSAPTAEVEVPNLEDVERLLEQLETTNPVADLQLEEVMEQNTAQIASEQASQVEELTETDELQDWDISVEEPVVEETVIEPEINDWSVDEASPEIEGSIETETQVGVEPQTQTGGGDLGEWHSTRRDEDFQALYFEVNGVMFAVPLDELGGIHRMAELNHLIGRPEWYLGLLTSKENQLDVVDTAKWVMPEKLTDEEYKDEYQYIVMLGSSLWGLASTQLKGTELLNTEKVRWREQAGKRPWLAGMVKEKMCALIHVEALIAMLNAGLDVKALDK